MGKELPKISLQNIETNNKINDKKTDIVNKLQDISLTKPSPYEAELRVKLRDKTMCNIGNIPTFINKIYETQAKELDMNKREYFYFLLRERGGDIPPYEQMDGRKL